MNDNQISPAGASSGTPLPSPTNPPLRILMVEDDISVSLINTELLIRAGYEVEAAKDGAAAWDALSGDVYDLMITDNSMPRMTGLELLKKLRSARMEMPVIMATSILPEREFARNPWLKPAATLVKPYTSDELLRTVKKVLCETQSADSLPKNYYPG